MERKLRIGMACFATYGGSGVVASELGRELARDGHTIHFISRNMPFRLEQGDFLENVYYHDVPTLAYDALPSQLYGLEMASRIIQLAADERLDIVHAHYAVPHAISGIIAKQVMGEQGPRIVTTLHGTDITLVGRAPAFFPVTKWSIEQSDAVSTVSNWLRDETRRQFDTAKPIHVIHNCVDPERFAPSSCRCRRRHFASDNEKIIMHMSNFRPVKRLDDVVRVFAAVNARVPSRLLLVGEGPEMERTTELARSLGVMNRVHCVGKQNCIEQFLGIADVFLFPSEYESFGVAALEALSCEVPVVATQGSGLSEVIDDGVTGLLCPVGDVEALSAAVMRLLSDGDLSARMGQAGRRRTLRCFQPTAIRDAYLRLYDSVLSGSELEPLKPCLSGE